jgi:glyoxylate reductase
MPMRPSIVVTQPIPGDAVARLRQHGDVTYRTDDGPLAKAELCRLIAHADAILPLLTDVIDADVMDAAPRLKIIANMAAGYNNIDVAAATARGIAVTNTPGVLSASTADLTFALILGSMRRVAESEAFLRRNEWQYWSATLLLGSEVHGSTLAIIGMGRIGLAVARRALAFDMRVLYVARSQHADADALGCTRVTLDEALAQADIVSLHVPASADTYHLIDAQRLAQMKPSAFLINTARGNVVDEAALARALHTGVIAGAGIDVFEHEPAIHPELLTAPNALLVPHIGSATLQTRSAMARMAAENIIAWIQQRRPPQLVNVEIAQ